MKALLASAAVAAALTLAAPASAHENYGPGNNYAAQSARQLERLHSRMDEGLRSGAINRWEARRLTSQYDALRNLRFAYQRSNGFNNWEIRDLNYRIANLRAAVQQAMFDGGNNGQYGRWDDRPDGWSDRNGRNDDNGGYERDDNGEYDLYNRR